MTRLLYWKWLILAPLFGALMTLSFAPYNYAVLAWVALVFFYAACNTQTPKNAAWSGYLFGLGLFGSGIWGVYVSVHDYGGASPLSATLLTALLVALWALFLALTAYWTAKIARLTAYWLRVSAFALLWVSVEYFRGYGLLNGFPWLQIAYSQIDTPLAGYAPLAGVFGVGFLLAAAAAITAEVWRHRGYIFGVLAVMAIVAGGWGLQKVAWTHAIGEPITVTLLQGNIDQAQKWQANQRLNTLRLYHRLTEQHWGSDIIIWPETAIPAFLSEVKDLFLFPLAAQARANGSDLVVSLPIEGTGGEYYNSVMALGRTEGVYHKQHLLPFGEYLPLQPLSGWVLDQLEIPLGDFAAGSDQQTLLRAGGYPFITTICYEDAFGELVARQAGQAAFLVNVTNDAWFGDSPEPYQHMQMAQMRALETGRYLLRATNTGVTGFVAPDGHIAKQAPLFTTVAVTDTVVPMGGTTPYARFGDRGVFACLIFLVLAVYCATAYAKRKIQPSTV
jgi:apolipoprotein N-acyltransferase